MLFFQDYIAVSSLQIITQFLIIICTFTLLLFNQPLKCLLGLTSVYILTSFLFMHLNSTFLGVLYLTVYIGAVVVLFLFVIMIIGDNNSISEQANIKKNGLDWNLLTIFVFFVIVYESAQDFISFIVQTVQSYSFFHTNSLKLVVNQANDFNFFEPTISVFDQFIKEPILWDTWAVSELRQIGLILYGTNQGLLILLVSLVLLVGMLGAIVLTTTELEYRQ